MPTPKKSAKPVDKTPSSMQLTQKSAKKLTEIPSDMLYEDYASLAEKIVFQGVKTNNLKDIDLTLPKNKIITITGVSGSGKSSLAFDTIYKEGQFRYIESLSSYLRQFFNL
jgi:ABC-type transport system involved in cytochrome bd biosynthesis fused ATPase/permease subunit